MNNGNDKIFNVKKSFVIGDQIVIMEGDQLKWLSTDNNDGADWMPFIPLKEYWGGMKRSTEVIWSNEKTNYDNMQVSLF